MGRVPLPLEEIGRRRHALATRHRIARHPPRTERVEPRAQSAMPLVATPRDRCQAHDLGVGELERPGLAQEHRGRGRSEGHASWHWPSSLWLLCGETGGPRGEGDQWSNDETSHGSLDDPEVRRRRAPKRRLIALIYSRAQGRVGRRPDAR